MTDLLDAFAFGGSSRSDDDEPDVGAWQEAHGTRTRYDILQDISGGRPPVTGSDDLERILKLPRRPQVDLGGEKLSDGTVTPPSLQALAMVQLVGERLRRPDRPRGWRGPCKCALLRPPTPSAPVSCILDLLPAQAWALYEAPLAGGLLGVLATGSGKCLAAGSEYFDLSRGRRSDVAVEDSTSVTVMSLTDDKLEACDALNVPSGSKPCVRVLLADGSAITASTDHPILTQQGWVHASQLSSSDFVAVATKMPPPHKITEATDAEVSLLGLLYADGGFNGDMIRYTKMDPELVAEFQKCAAVVCGGWSERTSKSKAREFSLLGTHNGFRERWDLRGLSKNKRLHPDLWGLSDKQVALFLNRFWASDGHVSSSSLELVLASEKLLDDIRFLMLRLGIRSRKHFKQATCAGKKFDAWRLAASGADAEKFLAEVGDLPGKRVACERLRQKLASTARNTNFDVIPATHEELVEEARQIYPRGTWTRISRFLGSSGRGRHVSRAKLLEYRRTYNYNGFFCEYLIEGVAWERVSGVSDAGTLPVYDLSVPAAGNFVANNMIVHNTAVGFLMVVAMWLASRDCNLAVGLVPSNLVKQLVNEYKLWREHWLVPNLVWGKTESEGPQGSQFDRTPGWPTLHVIPYSIISREENSTRLKDLGPKLIYADEMHRLSRMDSARTSRFVRAFKQCPSTKFCGWTGTPWDKEIEEVAHLMDFALRENSPLPRDPYTVKVWGTAINPSENPADAGALLRLCEPGEVLYSGFRRRLVETEGVVATQEGAISIPHYLYGRYPGPMSLQLQADLKALREDWERPDKELMLDIFEQSKTLRELLCGFYYRWIFPRIERTPDGKPTPKARAQVELWYARRKAWRKELRTKLEPREEELDSEKLCTDAAKRFHAGYDGPLPVWESDTYLDWAEVEDTVYHETEAVWVDDYLVNDAIAWSREHRGVIWYEHTALGERIARLSGLPLHEGGPNAEARILAEKGDRSLVVSIDSHGTGRDGLQRLYDEQLVTSPPASGKLVEQLFARLHRVGARGSCVRTWVNRHVPEFREAIRRSAKRGQFAGETLCGSQKLLTAISDFDLGLDEE